MSVALLVLPDFMLVALGWALRHKLGFSREFFAGAERLVYFVLFPALLFQAILHPHQRRQRRPAAAGHGRHDRCRRRAVVAGRPVLRPTSIGLASAAQCGYRFNTYIGLALSASVGGAQGRPSWR